MQVVVATYSIESDELVTAIQINLLSKSKQDWFKNHLVWAVNNGMVVEVYAEADYKAEAVVPSKL